MFPVVIAMAREQKETAEPKPVRPVTAVVQSFASSRQFLAPCRHAARVLPVAVKAKSLKTNVRNVAVKELSTEKK